VIVILEFVSRGFA